MLGEDLRHLAQSECIATSQIVVRLDDPTIYRIERISSNPPRFRPETGDIEIRRLV